MDLDELRLTAGQIEILEREFRCRTQRELLTQFLGQPACLALAIGITPVEVERIFRRVASRFSENDLNRLVYDIRQPPVSFKTYINPKP